MASQTQKAFAVRGVCPACGGDSYRTLTDLPYTAPPISDYLLDFYGTEPGGNILGELDGVRYSLLECTHCGMIWQHRAPPDDLVERLYETWIDPEDSLHRDTDAGLDQRVPLVREVMSIVSMMDRPPGRLRVLDFGMGWGRWLMIARGLGCQVWGAELSKARVAHARELAIPSVSWDEIPNHEFDVINTEQVFEHLVEPFEALAHLSRALAPGGLLKISVPPNNDIHRRLKANDWKAPKFTRNSLNAVAPLEHLNCYHGRSLTVIAERAGLEQFFPSARVYYRFVTPSGGLKNVAKQLVKPIYRNRLKRGAYRFFRRPSA
jgi:SAM-dependent methyltransferase